MLVSASRSILDLKGQAQKTVLSIAIFGRRKAYRFLAKAPNHPPPMGGLPAVVVTNEMSMF